MDWEERPPLTLCFHNAYLRHKTPMFPRCNTSVDDVFVARYAHTSARCSRSKRPLLTLIFTRSRALNCCRISSRTVSLNPAFPIRTLGLNSREAASRRMLLGTSLIDFPPRCSMMLWSTTKTADGAANQACFDALSTFDSNPKLRNVGMMGPAAPAESFLSIRGQRQPMPARGLHEVHGGCLQNLCGVVFWGVQDGDKVVLGKQRPLTTVG
jgi:hypothetical protein